MGKLIAGILIFVVIFFVAMNTQMISDQTTAWVSEHGKDPSAPTALFWAGWWANILGDNQNAEKMFWTLYKQYPTDSDHVCEGLLDIADNRSQGAAKMSAVDYCNIVIQEYPSEQKWLEKAQKLKEQVKLNVQ